MQFSFLLFCFLIGSCYSIGDKSNNVSLSILSNITDFNVNQYNSHQVINDWLDSLAIQYANLVSLQIIGRSHEGRNMKVIKIGNGKVGLWVDAGTHGREWIGISSTLYIINMLLTKYDCDEDYQNILSKVTFYILPVVNPDGYEYSRNVNRFWRKSRSGPYCKAIESGTKCCYGVDINRNWHYKWMGSGSSSDPCSNSYAGPWAFSEIETRQVAQYILSLNDTIKAFLTIHSYGEYWLHLYSFAHKTYPLNIHAQCQLMEQAVAAIQGVAGTKYIYGSPGDLLYPIGGSSMDWAAMEANITLAFGIELSPSKRNTKGHNKFYGYLLPAHYIARIGKEAWAGIRVVAEKLIT